MKILYKRYSFFILNIVFDICFYEMFAFTFPVHKRNGEFFGEAVIYSSMPTIVTTTVSILLASLCFFLLHGTNLRCWKKNIDFEQKNITRHFGKLQITYQSALWHYYVLVALLSIFLVSFTVNLLLPQIWFSICMGAAFAVSAFMEKIGTGFFHIPSWQAFTIATFAPQIIYQAIVFAVTYLFLKTIFVKKTLSTIEIKPR